MTRVPYFRELEELPVTFEAVRGTDLSPVREELGRLGVGPARFIGTGGTSALAQLASDLQEGATAQLARSLTPLEFLTGPELPTAGAMLFSARAKHPDATLVLERFATRVSAPAVLMTHRDPADFPAGVRAQVGILRAHPPELREGFLATNSVISMAATLVGAHKPNGLPPRLLSDVARFLAAGSWSRPQLLVVHPPNLASVARDIETRCSELGVAAVQLSDLRNVAHGRHTGLFRNAPHTTLLVLSSTETRTLADSVGSTLSHSGADYVRWHSDHDWPTAALELLAASMYLAGLLADRQGFDAGRPSVPEFGRKLYNLPIKRILKRDAPSAVERKVQSVGSIPTPRLREFYSDAYRSWVAALSTANFGGLVLDYDGTVVSTRARTELPSPQVQNGLLRALESGLIIGFASGRGKSLHADLRKWVPAHLWSQVLLGLYNGSVELGLTDELADLSVPSDFTQRVSETLAATSFSDLFRLVTRSTQVTVEARSPTFFRPGRLAELVRNSLESQNVQGAKVVSSGHSVDIVEATVSKSSVVDSVQARTLGEVLACGDQGDLGGNDFELLASTRWSISVDACSPDPLRCWPAAPRNAVGPEGLANLLSAMRFSSGLGRLRLTV